MVAFNLESDDDEVFQKKSDAHADLIFKMMRLRPARDRADALAEFDRMMGEVLVVYRQARAAGCEPVVMAMAGIRQGLRAARRVVEGLPP